MRRSLVLLAAVLLTSSCTPSDQGAAVIEISTASMLKVDSALSPSSLPRVAAVGNGSAELIVAMGLAEIIVGRDIASEIPELDAVPIVTDGHELSAEKVLQSQPDLLIIDPNTSPESALRQIARAGVRVIEMPESYSLTGINAKIAAIAGALLLPESGQRLTAAIAQEIKEIPSLESAPLDVLFLYLRGGNGIFLVGGKGSGADSLLEAAGANDLGSTLYENPFTPINSEAILGLAPDRYLLMSAGLESVGGINAFRELPGIDPKIPVITVDDSLLLAFGPRTPDLIRRLNEALYGPR